MSATELLPLDTALAQASQTLGHPVILITFVPTPDGQFETAFAHSSLQRVHVAAGALDLLRNLRDDITGDPCRDCEVCTRMLGIVEAAIAPLEGAEAGVPR